MPLPQDLFAFLNSPQGNQLGASDWNAVRDAAANQYNSRGGFVQGGYGASLGVPGTQGGYTQGGYGASLGVGQPTMAGSINIPTGKDSSPEPYDPGLAQQLARQYFTPNAPIGYGMTGNTATIGGQVLTNNLFGDASAAGMSPQDYVQAHVQQASAARPAFNFDTGYQNAMADPRLAQLPGVQRNALLTAASGLDPNTEAQLQQQRIMQAVKMQQEHQSLINSQLANTKTQQDIYESAFKSLGADNPEEARTTYNTDPAHPNQFKVSGKFVANPLNPGSYIQTPDRWVFAQPEDFQAALGRGTGLGYAPTSSGQQIAAMDQAKSLRMQQLMAKQGGGSQPSYPSQTPLSGPITADSASRFQSILAPADDPFGQERALSSQMQQAQQQQARQSALMQFLQSVRPTTGMVRNY